MTFRRPSTPPGPRARRHPLRHRRDGGRRRRPPPGQPRRRRSGRAASGRAGAGPVHRPRAGGGRGPAGPVHCPLVERDHPRLDHPQLKRLSRTPETRFLRLRPAFRRGLFAPCCSSWKRRDRFHVGLALAGGKSTNGVSRISGPSTGRRCQRKETRQCVPEAFAAFPSFWSWSCSAWWPPRSLRQPMPPKASPSSAVRTGRRRFRAGRRAFWRRAPRTPRPTTTMTAASPVLPWWW